MPTRARQDGRRRALLIATGDYEDERLRKLKAPSADVAALAEVLADEKIGDFAVEPPLVDRDKRTIEKSIGAFFHGAFKADTLLMYITGHGLLEHNELFFAAQDTEMMPGSVPATAVDSHHVRRSMARCRADRKVLVLDCCHSGAMVQGQVAKGNQDVELERRLASSGGVVVLTASSKTESAYETDAVYKVGDPASSVFTRALVQGLRSGEADRNGDGLISADELYEYIVAELTNPVSKTPVQTPNFFGVTSGGPLIIAWEREAAALGRDILDACRNAEPEVRTAGVRLLAKRLLDPQTAHAAAKQLALLVEDHVPEVARAAKDVLAPAATPTQERRRSKQRRPADRAASGQDLREAAASFLPEVRRASVNALGSARSGRDSLDAAAAETTLRQLAEDADPEVSHAARDALSRSEPKAKRKDLTATLSGRMHQEGQRLCATWELTLRNGGETPLGRVTATLADGESLERPFDLASGKERKLTWTKPAKARASAKVSITATTAAGRRLTRTREATAAPLPFSGSLDATLIRFEALPQAGAKPALVLRATEPSPALGLALKNNSNHTVTNIVVARSGLSPMVEQDPLFKVEELAPNSSRMAMLNADNAPKTRPSWLSHQQDSADSVWWSSYWQNRAGSLPSPPAPQTVGHFVKPEAKKPAANLQRFITKPGLFQLDQPSETTSTDPFPVGSAVVVTAKNEDGHVVRTTTTIVAAPNARIPTLVASKPAAKAAPKPEPKPKPKPAPAATSPAAPPRKGRFRRFLGDAVGFAASYVVANDAPVVALKAPFSQARLDKFEFALRLSRLSVTGEFAGEYAVGDLQNGVHHTLTFRGETTRVFVRRTDAATLQVGVTPTPLIGFPTLAPG